VIDAAEPVSRSKWFRWRADGKALIDYLLDSGVHTFAFSVAANAIISFIPFIVLLYTLSRAVFHSHAMVDVVSDMVNYFLPTTASQGFITYNLEAVCSSARRAGALAGHDPHLLHGNFFFLLKWR